MSRPLSQDSGSSPRADLGSKVELRTHRDSVTSGFSEALSYPSPTGEVQPVTDVADEECSTEDEDLSEEDQEEEEETGPNTIVALSELPMTLPPELEVPLNPFRMKFADPELEAQYADWIHLKYIPSRGWLLMSALLTNMDMLMYGPASVTAHVAVMHAINVVQIAVFALMFVPRLYPYRRYMVYAQFLHVFFWTGVTTQQAAAGESGLHRNSWLVLPFYCTFICALSAQVPARHSVVIMCIFPLANALWRVLAYYAVPSTSVTLVWWLLVAVWIYAFERVTRHLFGWVVTAEKNQKLCEQEKAELTAVLRGLIPRSVIRQLEAAEKNATRAPRSARSAAVDPEGNKSPAQEKLPKTAAPAGKDSRNVQKRGMKKPEITVSPSVEKQETPRKDKKLESTFTTDLQATIVIICVQPTNCSAATSHALFDFEEVEKLADRHGFQRVSITPTRYTCVSINAEKAAGEDADGHVSPTVVFLEAMFGQLDSVTHFSDVFFIVERSSVVSGLMITADLCRPCVLSAGLAKAHGHATSVEGLSGVEKNGKFFFLAEDAEIISDLRLAAVTPVPVSSSSSESVSGAQLRMAAVPKGFIKPSDMDEKKIQQEDSAGTVGLFLAIRSITSFIENVGDFLGPVPEIKWRTALSRRGLLFSDPAYEKNYRKFVVTEIPELYVAMAGFAMFSGLWTIVTLIVVILPCQFLSSGGILGWALGHAVLLVLSCVISHKLYRGVQSRDLEGVKRCTYGLFGTLLAHYALCIAALCIQPGLTDAGNWWDYISTVLHQRTQHEHGDGLECVNVLYQMSYFVLFSLFFCVGVVPMFLNTTARFIAMVVLSSMHGVIAAALVRYVDFAELGLVVCIACYTVASEALVRMFYKALLDANRARLEIEQQEIVLCACVPPRLLHSPDHSLCHGNGGLLFIQFPTLNEVLERSLRDQRPRAMLLGAMADFGFYITTLQGMFSEFSQEASMVYMSMRDGSPGILVLLLFDESLTETHCQRASQQLAHRIGERLLKLPETTLNYPCTFRMSCTVRSVTERSVAGYHHLDPTSINEAEAAVGVCMINCISFSGVPFSTRLATVPSGVFGASGAIEAVPSAISASPSVVSATSSVVAATPSVTFADGVRNNVKVCSKVPMPEERTGLPGVVDSSVRFRSTSVVSHRVLGRTLSVASNRTLRARSQSVASNRNKGSRRLQPTRSMRKRVLASAYLALTWRPSAPDLLTTTSFHSDDAISDDLAPVLPARDVRVVGVGSTTDCNVPPPDQLMAFNRSYIRDMLAIYPVLRSLPKGVQIQQRSNDGICVVITLEEQTKAAQLAEKLARAIWAENPATSCMGIGMASVVAEQGAPLVPSVAAETAIAAALELAELNKAHPAPPGGALGLPVLFGPALKQRVEFEYYIKPVLAGGSQLVFRLGDRQEQAADEWMYELADAMKHNKFKDYLSAFGLYRAGKLAEAVGPLDAYLQTHPNDTDARELRRRL
eukprot:RCo001537